jgi:predicted transcriptional regulator
VTAFDGELLERESNVRVTTNGDNELLETVQQQGWSSRAILETKARCVHTASGRPSVKQVHTGAPSPIQKRALVAM